MTDRKKRTTSLRDVRSRNVIEEAILLPRNLQNHRAHRQFSKCRRRAAALPLLLGAGQALDLRISRMKSELAVKPECAAVDRFVVAQSDLIRIDSENGRSEKLPIELQQPREAPCRFPLAKRGKDVEADFDSLAEDEGVAVSDRHSVAKKERSVSIPNRKALVGTHAEENNLQPAARFGRDDRRRIAECGDVQLSIARGQCGARDVQRRLSFVGRKSLNRKGRRAELAHDGHIASRDDCLVEEKLTRRAAHPRL